MTKTSDRSPDPSTVADGQTALSLLLGGDLRDLRERHGLTAAMLGERLGVTASGICRWERGNRSPRLGTVLRIAAVLRQLEKQP
jgi:DNA-binding XRE family transcriptional regulator